VRAAGPRGGLPARDDLTAAFHARLSGNDRTVRGVLANTVSTPVALRLDGDGGSIELGARVDGTLGQNWGWSAAYGLEVRDDGDAGHRYSLALRTRF